MADFITDYFPIIMALIAVIIAPALIYFSRQSTSQVVVTGRLETYSKTLDKIEEEQDKRFNVIQEKLDLIIRKQDNLDWRLGATEDELQDIRDKKIVALQQELQDLRNHKTRIANLESELKELRRQRASRSGGDRAPL